jgi:endoglycosylceramidase
LHQKRIGTRDEDAKKLGIPLIMSEFGACMNTSECVTEVTQVTDVADEHLAGWAYWEFKTYKDLTTSAGTGSEGFYNDSDGTLQTGKVKALSRSYVKAAQGTTKSMKFDTKTGNFEAIVELDLSIEKPTLIHAHQDATDAITWYPHGINFTIESVDTNATVKATTTQVGNEL